MAELSDAAKRAMSYWSVIESAARERWTTGRTWEALRDAAAAAGLDKPGVSAAGVAQLRGYASTIQRAAREFERAHGDTGFRYEHAADAPWSRPLREQNALPMFQVRYQHTTITPEGPQTEWRTSMFHGAMPDTIEGVRDAIDGDGEQLADKYGTEHGGVGAIQVMRV